MNRCKWVKDYDDADLMVQYHDNEWGKPLYDDQKLFELLCLEIYQAGLSWRTVLNKRESFRVAFHNYDINAVAQMTDGDLEGLMTNTAIIRNRLKLRATVANAKAIIILQKSGTSFSDWLWNYVEGQPIDHHINNAVDRPTQDELSILIAKSLKKNHFKFVGPTTVYSFLQSAGLVNDHEISCAFHL